ncbi:MAG: sel1 repeat family protein [Idiomarina sp.]|nr:sel1 repeat family protein [Idiomarina sp.]
MPFNRLPVLVGAQILLFLFFTQSTYAKASSTAPAAMENDKAYIQDAYRLAESGDADAQLFIGYRYLEGTDTPRDMERSIRWLTRAAAQDNVTATIILGTVYAEGELVKQDPRLAYQWFNRAAAFGEEVAQARLGLMYLTGEGTIQDLVYAHMWFNIAYANGHEESARLRDDIAQELNRAELSEARSLARQCMRKQYRDC